MFADQVNAIHQVVCFVGQLRTSVPSLQTHLPVPTAMRLKLTLGDANVASERAIKISKRTYSVTKRQVCFVKKLFLALALQIIFVATFLCAESRTELSLTKTIAVVGVFI